MMDSLTKLVNSKNVDGVGTQIIVGKFVGFTIMYCSHNMSIPKLSPCAKYVVSIVLI